jgi:hypothetical protein
MTSRVFEQRFQGHGYVQFYLHRDCLKYRTRYRVFTNASEIRQVYDWQTDRGTEPSAFRAGKHLWCLIKQELQTENAWRNRPTAVEIRNVG